MNIRTDTLTTNLTRFLGRFSPPRGMNDQGIADSTSALLRAIDRAAPMTGYDAWWPRFEDRLEESMTTRAWPTVSEVAKVAKSIPLPDSAKVDDDDWMERGILKRIRRFLDGSPGEGEKGILPHLVTVERLNALGVFGSEAERVLRFIADPYNHGIDKGLTHKDRARHAASFSGAF